MVICFFYSSNKQLKFIGSITTSSLLYLHSISIKNQNHQHHHGGATLPKWAWCSSRCRTRDCHLQFSLRGFYHNLHKHWGSHTQKKNSRVGGRPSRERAAVTPVTLYLYTSFLQCKKNTHTITVYKSTKFKLPIQMKICTNYKKALAWRRPFPRALGLAWLLHPPTVILSTTAPLLIWHVKLKNGPVGVRFSSVIHRVQTHCVRAGESETRKRPVQVADSWSLKVTRQSAVTQTFFTVGQSS